MAAHLLRLFAATVGALAVTLAAIIAVLRVAASGTLSPTHAANLALAEAFVDRAPLLVPGLVGGAGAVAFIGLLVVAALCTTAVIARYRKPAVSPQGEREER